MTVKLSEPAKEGGTYGIRVSFFEKADPDDAQGTPFTPNSGLSWSLYDQFGNVINDKEDEPLTPAESVVITLSGADLALTGGPTRRYVTVKGTYNGVLGNNLALVDEVSFPITNLVGQP